MWIYFILTLLVEIPVYYLFKKTPLVFTILTLFLSNAFTWSCLHIVLHYFNWNIYILEFVVVWIEAIILNLFLVGSFTRSFFIALVQNAASFFLGVWVHKFHVI
jgi:hypothetical protein